MKTPPSACVMVSMPKGWTRAKIGVEGNTAAAGGEGEAVVFAGLVVDRGGRGEEDVAARRVDHEVAIERRGTVDPYVAAGGGNGQQISRPRPTVEADGLAGDIDLARGVDGRHGLKVGVNPTGIVPEEDAAVGLCHGEIVERLDTAKIGVPRNASSAGREAQIVELAALAIDRGRPGEKHIATRRADREAAIERHGTVDPNVAAGGGNGQQTGRPAAIEDDAAADDRIGAQVDRASRADLRDRFAVAVGPAESHLVRGPFHSQRAQRLGAPQIGVESDRADRLGQGDTAVSASLGVDRRIERYALTSLVGDCGVGA